MKNKIFFILLILISSLYSSKKVPVQYFQGKLDKIGLIYFNLIKADYLDSLNKCRKIILGYGLNKNGSDVYEIEGKTDSINNIYLFFKSKYNGNKYNYIGNIDTATHNLIIQNKNIVNIEPSEFPFLKYNCPPCSTFTVLLDTLDTNSYYNIHKNKNLYRYVNVENIIICPFFKLSIENHCNFTQIYSSKCDKKVKSEIINNRYKKKLNILNEDSLISFNNKFKNNDFHNVALLTENYICLLFCRSDVGWEVREYPLFS
jgi:hypothetical protein